MLSNYKILTYYDVLGVEPDAPPEKIQAIYRFRSRSAYPRRPGVGNLRLQQQLNEAYQTLKNPISRIEYNLQMGLPLHPRPLYPGQAYYVELQTPSSSETTIQKVTYKRWEPCKRCWTEGCIRCSYEGYMAEKVVLNVSVPPGISQILVEGEGTRVEPCGERGNLIIYVVFMDQLKHARTR